MSKEQYSLFIDTIASEMQNDLAFKSFHQSHYKKGVFRLVKSKFHDMLQLLKSSSAKTLCMTQTDFETAMESGGKIFAYYQYKLFTWISVWVIHRNHITYNQIFSVSLQVLEKIFKTKSPSIIRFEFFLILSHLHRGDHHWTMKESRFAQGAISQWVNSLPNGINNINWKLVSYRMFTEKMMLRTPHQCRERWINHINPFIKKGKWTQLQDVQLITLYRKYGQKWSILSKIMVNRNEHMIKNRFNSLKHKWIKNHGGSNQSFSLQVLLDDLSICRTPISRKNTRKCQLIQSQASQSHNVATMNNPQTQIKVIQDSKVKQYEQFQGISEYLTVKAQSPDQSVSQSLQSIRACGGQGQVKPQITQYESMRQETVRLSQDDYEWLDRLIEEKNMIWLDEENS